MCAGVLPEANPAEITLALQPQHPNAASDLGRNSSLFRANEICDLLRSEPGSEALGIAFDTYHLLWEPALEDQIAWSRTRIRWFLVSDWLDPLRRPGFSIDQIVA